MRVALRALLCAVTAGVAAIGSASPALGAQGDLDSSFGSGGSVAAGAVDNVVAPDGTHVVVGDAVSQVGGMTSTSVMVERFNANGTPDQSFGSGGKTVLQLGTPYVAGSPGPTVPASSWAQGVALQRDGRIDIVGMATDGPNHPARKLFVARLLANGQIDSSFGSGGTVLDQPGGARDRSVASGVIVLPDAANPSADDIVLAGTTTAVVTTGGVPKNVNQVVLERYDPTGAPVQGGAWGSNGRIVVQLGSGSAPDSEANAIAAAGNGFVIAGTATDAAASQSGSVLVAAFQGDGTQKWVGVHQYATGAATYYSLASAVTVDASGRIDVGGLAQTGDSMYFGLAARYNADGSPDSSFGPGGQGFFRLGVNPDPHYPYQYFFGNAIAVAGNGDVVLAGQAGTDPEQGGQLALVAFKDPSTDACFGHNGVVLSNVSRTGANAIAVQRDGNLVVGGDVLARYFGPGVGPCGGSGPGTGGTGGGGNGGGGTHGGGGPGGSGKATAQLLRSGAARVVALSAGRLGVQTGISVRCRGVSGRCSISAQAVMLSVSKATAARSTPKSGRVTVGQTAITIPAGKTVRITIVLSPRGAALLRKLGTMRVRVSVRVRSGNGVMVTTTRDVVVRAPTKSGRHHGKRGSGK